VGSIADLAESGKTPLSAERGTGDSWVLTTRTNCEILRVLEGEAPQRDQNGEQIMARIALLEDAAFHLDSALLQLLQAQTHAAPA